MKDELERLSWVGVYVIDVGELAPHDIGITDVITLKGTVASAAEKAKAEQVANGIEGKKKVVNELKVAANDSMTNMSGNSNAKTNSNTSKK